MGTLDFLHGQSFAEALNSGSRALDRQLAGEKALRMREAQSATIEVLLEVREERDNLRDRLWDESTQLDAEQGIVTLMLEEIKNNAPQRRFSSTVSREFRDLARDELKRLSRTDRRLASEGGRFSSNALPILRDRLKELTTELFQDPKRTQLHDWVIKNCQGNVTEEIKAYQQCVNTGLREQDKEEIDFMALYRLNTPETKSKEEWEANVRANVPDADRVLASYQAKYTDPAKYFEAIKALGEHATMMASRKAAEADEEAQEILGQLQDEAMGLFGRTAYRAVRIGIEAQNLDIQGQISEFQKAIDGFKNEAGDAEVTSSQPKRREQT